MYLTFSNLLYTFILTLPKYFLKFHHGQGKKHNSFCTHLGQVLWDLYMKNYKRNVTSL